MVYKSIKIGRRIFSVTLSRFASWSVGNEHIDDYDGGFNAFTVRAGFASFSTF